MRWNPVKEKLYRRGFTLHELARIGGFEESHLKKVISFTRFNREIQDFIADILDEGGEAIFAEFYWKRRRSG